MNERKIKYAVLDALVVTNLRANLTSANVKVKSTLDKEIDFGIDAYHQYGRLKKCMDTYSMENKNVVDEEIVDLIRRTFEV